MLVVMTIVPKNVTHASPILNFCCLAAGGALDGLVKVLQLEVGTGAHFFGFAIGTGKEGQVVTSMIGLVLDHVLRRGPIVEVARGAFQLGIPPNSPLEGQLGRAQL